MLQKSKVQKKSEIRKNQKSDPDIKIESIEIAWEQNGKTIKVEQSPISSRRQAEHQETRNRLRNIKSYLELHALVFFLLSFLALGTGFLLFISKETLIPVLVCFCFIPFVIASLYDVKKRKETKPLQIALSLIETAFAAISLVAFSLV